MRSKSWLQRLKLKNWQRAGFGIYVHWPFCQAKCPYCDFNSHVVSHIDQRSWRDAYLAEIDRYAALTPDRVVSTIFFGGGTPSLMDPDLVFAVIDRIRSSWRCTNDLEITLEANPTSVEAARFVGYRDAGVSRVSMGIQALSDVDLKALGRLHSVSEARTAFDIARKTFDRISFDLIYARQDQSLSQWKHELSEALAMAADHLSLYQLTIEDGTAFGDRFARGKLGGLPTDDTAADMYQLTQDLTERAGLPAYEVSNHAKHGEESRHNLIYWRGGDYVGIGPGAHGRYDLAGQRVAIETHLAPQLWLEAVSKSGNGESVRSKLTRDDQATEYAMMSLRLAEGCDRHHLRALGDPISDININKLAEMGHLEVSEDSLRVPADSRILLNTILAELLA